MPVNVERPWKGRSYKRGGKRVRDLRDAEVESDYHRQLRESAYLDGVEGEGGEWVRSHPLGEVLDLPGHFEAGRRSQEV